MSEPNKPEKYDLFKCLDTDEVWVYVKQDAIGSHHLRRGSVRKIESEDKVFRSDFIKIA